jgi:RNA polymerase sigma-70 factor (ECF subfamily)
MPGDTRDLVTHIPRLRRYARALAGDRARADDLVQDTLERAMLKFHLWQSGSDLRAWLFTIMHNVFVNQLRAQPAGVSGGLDDEAGEVTVRPTQNDLLEVRDVQAALLRLPEAQREVLLLVGLEQMSYGETAEVLGVPAGTVMSRLSRARAHLRRVLDGEDSQPSLKVVR